MAANPLPTPTLTLVTEKTPTEATVRCSGRITMENADQLRDTARKLIAESKRLVLDLSDVSYLGLLAGHDRRRVHLGQEGQVPVEAHQSQPAREGDLHSHTAG